MTSYRYYSLIGMGAYGAVYLVECDNDGEKEYVASKYLFNTESEGVMNPQEIAIFASFDHPNLCRGLSLKNEIEEFRKHPPPGRENIPDDSGCALTIWLQYATERNLADYLNSNEISLSAKIDIFHQIVCGIEFLHHVNILHLDIKPANVLIYRDPENPISGVRAKITDFGSCCYTTPSKTRYFKSEIVTINVRPPENFSDCQYSQATDVWSLGIVLLEILNQSSVYSAFDEDYIKSALPILFNDNDRRLNLTNMVKVEKVPLGPARDNIIDLLDKMMCYTPGKRIKPDEILNHELFCAKPKPQGSVIDCPLVAPNFDEIDVNCFVALHRIINYGVQCNIRTETVFLAITLFWRIYAKDHEVAKVENYNYKLTSVACFWLAYKMIEPDHLLVSTLESMSGLTKSNIIDRENIIIFDLRGVLYPWNLYNYCYNFPICLKAFNDIINPKVYFACDIAQWLQTNAVAGQEEIPRLFKEFYIKTEWSQESNNIIISQYFFNKFMC